MRNWSFRKKREEEKSKRIFEEIMGEKDILFFKFNEVDKFI